jgi:hypothetical protein
MCARYGRTRRTYPKIKVVYLLAFATLVVVIAVTIWVFNSKTDNAYHPPSVPALPEHGTTEAYAIITGTLRGVGILTLDGKKASFEPIGDSSVNDLAAEYKSVTPRGTRSAIIGGDFAGESGLIEYPTRNSKGKMRIFLKGSSEPIPMAISIVLSEDEPSKDNLARLVKLTNHYKGEALLERAEAALNKNDPEAAEGFAHQALQANADIRRGTYLVARSLVEEGKSDKAKALLSSSAESGTLNASGYDLWLKLLDKENRSSDGVAILEKVIKSGKLDNITLLDVRGSVFHRYLVNSARYPEAKDNLEEYLKLAATEEAGERLPISPENAIELNKHIEEIIAGKPTQLLEERFDKKPDLSLGEMTGDWKLTEAKGESFLTATPFKSTSSELFLESNLGFTKDIRISMRCRLREANSRLDLYPEWDGNCAYRLAATSTWARLYYASPPRQSDLEAKLLNESRFDTTIEGNWISISVTERGGALSVSVDGKVIIDAKDKEYIKHGKPTIIVNGGVVDIDDIVVTSF